MPNGQDRLPALDALRGIAALGVVLFHYLPYYDKLYGHSFSTPDTLGFGRYGVHLFFILSGFVIFMTLERTRSASWFGLARAFRLLPALWAGIVLTWIAVQLMGPADRMVSPGSALLNITLLHEYLGHPHVDGAYWSLVIEATFYVWIALLFYGLGSWQRMRPVLWAWTLASYAAVIWWKAIPDGLEFLIKDLLFTRYAPLFISGMLIYRWHRHSRLPVADLALLTLTISHCLLAYKAPFNLFVLGCYGVFGLAVAGYLNFLARPGLLWLGSISYTLYLVHQNIGYGVIDLAYKAGLPGQLGVMMALAVAIGLATALHYGIEKPALRWFRQWRKRAVPDTGLTLINAPVPKKAENLD
ncbi:acyltransferase family protein [Marinobacter nauticus]|uniref:acyltransferase family protein n=1 Tax=Marinobacter nauticus TaxID=2743 RepID=UPI001C997AB4|nr:acyltransferase [Marinobacter nauticus]MBY5960553.1 acyltransferase [Marinobacter nauticus]